MCWQAVEGLMLVSCCKLKMLPLATWIYSSVVTFQPRWSLLFVPEPPVGFGCSHGCVCVWHHWVHLVRVGLLSWRACWGGLSRAQAQLKAADFGSGVVLPENQPLMGPQPWLGCGGGNQHPVFLQRPAGSQGEPWGADTILWFEAVQ